MTVRTERHAALPLFLTVSKVIAATAERSHERAVSALFEMRKKGREREIERAREWRVG